MDLTFKTKRFITTLYLAPTISPAGWITAWGNRHSSWKSGFVVRFLWLGFLLRWGKIPYKPYQTLHHPWINDYMLDLALAEEPH